MGSNVAVCDARGSFSELASDHLPQDLLYVITLYVEALGNAIRAAHGALSYVELDSICALFGLECDTTQAAQQALHAAGAIESAISDLNERLGRQWDCKMKIAQVAWCTKSASEKRCCRTSRLP